MTINVPKHDAKTSDGFPQFDLDPVYRMPATLGPAPGPRNMPHSRKHLSYVGDSTSLTVRALTDEKRLSKLLPPGCRLAGEPIISASVTMLANLGWLAGRGYNLTKVTTEVIYESSEGPVNGNLALVLWENHADPILTGREELGMTKLYCNIPALSFIDDRIAGSSDWEGYRFFDIEGIGMKAADTSGGLQPYGSPAGPRTLCYRYHHQVGNWQMAAIDEMTASTKGLAPPPVIKERFTGEGRFSFKAARWEDMPTQYPYPTTLASLPLVKFLGAVALRSSGIADLAAMETLKPAKS